MVTFSEIYLKEKEIIISLNKRLEVEEMSGKLTKKEEKKIEKLIKKLKDENMDVRWGAACALGKIGEKAEQAVPALIKALKDEESGVRWRVAWVLGKIGEKAKQAVPALTKALKDEESRVREEATWALGKIGEKAEQAVPALTKALKDEEAKVREEAVSALGKIGEKAEKAVPFLTQFMNSLGDNLWRFKVITCLGNIGTDEAAFAIAERFFIVIDNKEKEITKQALEKISKKKGLTLNQLLEILQKPSVFIIYSWDSKKHKSWVKETLGERFEEEGMDVFLDQMKVDYGESISEFIGKMEHCDYILLIFTEKLHEKITNGIGYAAFEEKMASILDSQGWAKRRIIPIIREKSVIAKLPAKYKDQNYVDMSDDTVVEDRVNELIEHFRKKIYIKKRLLANEVRLKN